MTDGLASVYDIWEDFSVLEDPGAMTYANEFTFEGWVSWRIGVIAQNIAWVRLRASSSFGSDNPKAHESARNRLESCLLGYRSIFPSMDVADLIETKLLLVHTDIDIPIVEWIGLWAEESERALRWFVTISRWYVKNKVPSLSSIISSDSMLTPEEFAIAKSNSGPRAAKRLANRITNQIYSEFRTVQTLYRKVDSGA